ncbi:hypothetical protein DEU38_103151 [Rhodococcus sp. AG1013]|uniref:hypothetical protein n=1 Tax=Rhodococcus sp. AG1013 TaxID=2183996 RepID=UPI000E0A9622|nr:hypothetical protein [Rhodococcus sp. AG1013]RDI32418.1 hypothetical protein DEU38_103151 [Rhodococcus sp. AG1013]
MGHTVHLTRITRDTHAGPEAPTEAIRRRAERLRDVGTPFERDGMTLRFNDNGADITLTYEENS